MKKQIKNWEENFELQINKAVEKAVANATEPLTAKIKEQSKIIEEQKTEIKRLKTQIDKNSSNSSKPPSSNGFKKIPNNREKSVRKQGGQKGHTGHKLTIPQNLDELVKKGKAEHIVVNEIEKGKPYVSDWTVDVKFTTVYTEHRRAIGTLPKIEYGKNIKSLAVYLNTVGIVAYKRPSDFFREITEGLVTVSKSTLEPFIHSKAQEINLEELIQDILNGKVTHVDETPFRTSERQNAEGILETSDNTSFQAYIRTYSNSRTTVLTASRNKSEQSVKDDNILTRFHGIVSQDHEAKFYKFGDSHATCGAHLSRELKGMAELQRLSWADDVRCLFQEMNNKKNEDIRNGVNYCEQALLCHFEERYDQLVNIGKEHINHMTQNSFGHAELRRMTNRLTDYKDCYLLFIRNYDAPFTNNEAERDLRLNFKVCKSVKLTKISNNRACHYTTKNPEVKTNTSAKAVLTSGFFVIFAGHALVGGFIVGMRLHIFKIITRDLRHCKTKQKISGCFRSWKGVLDYCKIRSLLATAKKRGLNLLATLANPLSLFSCSAGQ